MTMLCSMIDPMVSEGIMAVGTAATAMLLVAMVGFTAWSILSRAFAD